MSKRNRREHGRILSVETMQRGSALDVDAAAGATSITVADAGDFDEDGGWLQIGAQVVEFTGCDDDTGVITFKTGTTLTAAAEQGDPVAVYDPLYGEVVDYQVALVQLDGEYDNPDPVEAEVAEGVEDLPEGDRGKAGESCTLHRVADDEWEVVGVGGRSRKSRGLRAEWDDTYVLTAGDITAGVATIPLTHRPADEWLIAVLAGVPQRPSNYTLNYDAQTITWPLSGWEKAGDQIWVHYAYRKGISTSVIAGTVTVTLPAVGVAGSTLDTAALTGSVVGSGQVWNDANGGTYVQYSSGNARSPLSVPAQSIPSSGFTVKAMLKTTFTAATSGFGVSIFQAGGPGTLAAMTAGTATLDAEGWLNCPLVITAGMTATLADSLNAANAVLIIGSFASGQVSEARVVVTWEAA